MAISAFADPADDVPTPETEELYSYVLCLLPLLYSLRLWPSLRSWALTILCILLILSLWTSYYVQIKRIRAVHETVLSIFAGMFVGMIVWAAPGHLIRDMLVSDIHVNIHLILTGIGFLVPRNSSTRSSSIFFYRQLSSILAMSSNRRERLHCDI
jgi:sodium/hydrogen exchanger-like protein 6/7